jgi:phage portal protein BeeE
VAGMVDRVRGRAASLYGTRGDTPASQVSMRDMSISLDEWASYFSFGGLTYPLIQTTMGSVDKERIVGNAIAAFEGVSSVFSLIQARVQVFAQIRFQWTRFSGAMPGDLFGTDDLRVLEKPWPNGHTAQLLAKMEIDNSIGGNAYIVRPRKDRLARLRPDLVTICLGSEYDMESPADAPDVEVAGYAYFPRSGKPEWFWPWEIAHYAPLPDPNFQFLGLSWMTPCLREIQADALTTEHKYRFFANAATPNMAIKFDPSVGIEQVRAFKELVENEHRGAFNAYRTLYLGGGADPVPIGTNLQQLDFAVTQGHGEARLAAAAGVPASWVGFSEGLQGSSLNAGNFNAQRRRLMDGTMPHLWTAAANALEAVVPPPDSHANLWYDTRIPPMREDAQDIATIQQLQSQVISAYVMQGFTPESAVKAVANNDISLLKHSGAMSVQLHKPGEGPLPLASGNGAKPKAGAGAANGNSATGGGGSQSATG